VIMAMSRVETAKVVICGVFDYRTSYKVGEKGREEQGRSRTDHAQRDLRVNFHPKQTRLDLLVAQERRVKRDAYFALGRRAFQGVGEGHSLY